MVVKKIIIFLEACYRPEIEGDNGLHELVELDDHRIVLVRDGVFARVSEGGWVGNRAKDNHDFEVPRHVGEVGVVSKGGTNKRFC
jgi:hypothetical protein